MNNVVFEVRFRDLALTNTAATHRNAQRSHGALIAAAQRVPFSQPPALMHTAVGAATRQAVGDVGELFAKIDTTRHALLPVAIVAATATLEIEQTAGHIGKCQLATILVLQLV